MIIKPNNYSQISFEKTNFDKKSKEIHSKNTKPLNKERLENNLNLKNYNIGSSLVTYSLESILDNQSGWADIISSLDKVSNSGYIDINSLAKGLGTSPDKLKNFIKTIKNGSKPNKANLAKNLKKIGIDSINIQNEIINSFVNNFDSKIAISSFNNPKLEALNKFEKISSSHTVTLFNKLIDSNNNGSINLGEIKNYLNSDPNLNKLKDLSDKYNVSAGRNETILKEAIDGLKDLPLIFNDDNKVIIEPNPYSAVNWVSYMSFDNDTQVDIDNGIKDLNGKTNLEIKEVLNSKLGMEDSFELDFKKVKTYQNSKKIVKFEESTNNINNLSYKETISSFIDKISNNKEASFYLSNFIDNNNKETVITTVSILNKYLDGSNKGIIPDSDKLNFVTNLLHDISFPENIDQCNKGTCGAASMQIKTAKEDPIVYSQLSTNLANGKTFNKVIKNQAGKNLELKIKPNNTFLKDSNDKRTLSEKVFQNSIMSTFDDSFRPSKVNNTFDNSYDSSFSADAAQGLDNKSKQTDGMISKQINRISYILFNNSSNKTQTLNRKVPNFEINKRERISNKDYLEKNNYSYNNGYGQVNETNYRNPKDLLSEIKDDLSKDKFPSFEVNIHRMTITGYDKTNNSFDIISWGKKYSVHEKNLNKILKEVVLFNDKVGADFK